MVFVNDLRGYLLVSPAFVLMPSLRAPLHEWVTFMGCVWLTVLSVTGKTWYTVKWLTTFSLPGYNVRYSTRCFWSGCWIQDPYLPQVIPRTAR